MTRLHNLHSIIDTIEASSGHNSSTQIKKIQSAQKKILIIENAIKTIEKRIQKMEQLVK